MILKESKINNLFRNYKNNIFKNKLNDVLIGLELELQTNSDEQDAIFFDFSIQKNFDSFNIKEEHIKGKLDKIDYYNYKVFFNYFDSYFNEEINNDDFEIVQENRYIIPNKYDEYSTAGIYIFIVKYFPDNLYSLIEIKKTNDVDDTEDFVDFEKKQKDNQFNIYSLSEETQKKLISDFESLEGIDFLYYMYTNNGKEINTKYKDIPIEERILNYFKNTEDLYNIINKYGLEIDDGEHTSNSQDNFFVVEFDASLGKNEGHINTFELKTPYGFTLSEQIKFLYLFLENEKKMGGFVTNETCSMHVNVSIKGQEKMSNDFNWFIFYELFNENKYKLNTRMEGKKDNESNIEDTIIQYQKQIKKDIKNEVIKKINKMIFNLNSIDDLKKLVNEINRMLSDSIDKTQEMIKPNDTIQKKKSQKIQVSNETQEKNRIEFRIIGNDYLKELSIKYMVEMQCIYYQQTYPTKELKIEQKRKFISKILNEITNENNNKESKQDKLIEIMSNLSETDKNAISSFVSQYNNGNYGDIKQNIGYIQNIYNKIIQEMKNYFDDYNDYSEFDLDINNIMDLDNNDFIEQQYNLFTLKTGDK